MNDRPKTEVQHSDTQSEHTASRHSMLIPSGMCFMVYGLSVSSFYAMQPNNQRQLLLSYVDRFSSINNVIIFYNAKILETPPQKFQFQQQRRQIGIDSCTETELKPNTKGRPTRKTHNNTIKSHSQTCFQLVVQWELSYDQVLCFVVRL